MKKGKKINLDYTPEMIEDIKNAKPFDYEAHDKLVERELVEVLVDKFLWEQNDETTRKKFAEGLSKIYGYEFCDVSQPTIIDKQSISFHGFNPETKKMNLITISPA